MNDNFWQYGFPALAALLGVAATKLFEIWGQRRKQKEKDIELAGRLELDAGKFTWEQAQYLMSRYQADFKEVRNELLTVRAELVEAKKVSAGLQEQVFILRAQNEALTRTVERLQATLDATKKKDGG